MSNVTLLIISNLSLFSEHKYSINASDDGDDYDGGGGDDD